MHIYLGADHRGFQLKSEVINWLVSQQIPYTDFGATEFNAEDDYNDFAKKVAEAILHSQDEESFGILLCGSGQGMCMQANRYKGIRAALCDSANEALETRAHNDANVLCISADNARDHFSEILDSFLDAKPLPDEKYKRRCQKLDEE
jgi:ribose 5-phosphate isomerase B